mgnify:CR=1 FL=1
MKIQTVHKILNESRNSFTMRVQVIANKIMRKLNEKAFTKLNRGIYDDYKYFVTENERDFNLGNAFFTLCKVYCFTNYEGFETGKFKRINEKDPLILYHVENIRGKNIEFRIKPTIKHKSICAETDRKDKKIIIYIPVTIVSSNAKNSAIQEFIREVLIHELTHIFDTTKTVHHRPVRDQALNIVDAHELDYFIGSDEMLAYSVQAARKARKKGISFVSALHDTLRKHSSKNKNITQLVIDTYMKKLKTNKALYRRFKNLLKGKATN